MVSTKARTINETPIEGGEYHTPRLADAKKVAHILDLSEVTIYRMAKAGTLPSIRIGASVRFDLAAIDRWIEAQGR